MMNYTQDISKWLDLKLPIDKTVGSKKYELMLKFFKQKLKTFDFYKNEQGIIYCLNCKNKNWIFADRNDRTEFFFNKKYFLDFLFLMFDLRTDDDHINQQVVRRLIFDSMDILNEVCYYKERKYYWEKLILYADFTGRVMILRQLLEIMFKEVEFKKNNEYGGFVVS